MDDERLCGDEVEEEAEDPGEECLGTRTEVAEAVFTDREEEGGKENIGETDNEISDCERERAAKAVCAFIRKCGEVFEEWGEVCHSHKEHEDRSEEDGVDEGLNICLACVQARRRNIVPMRIEIPRYRTMRMTWATTL